ncbi:MAG: two-component system, chemotaxis family, CheB/CheR fusion protein [Myxococcales bacterium]|jgi:two-component system CheB/CheR fusion protein|nr:two-component system, chemotaxis family, CheB/CheR fusion protein [Myxococcales bacterium]
MGAKAKGLRQGRAVGSGLLGAVIGDDAAKPLSSAAVNGKAAGGNSPRAAGEASSKPCPSYPFPIVGIGASAGGLDAFTQVLKLLPADSGMAFVLIQHLDPTHKSLLGESLRRATHMPVTQVEDGEHAQPNHVYVIPPDADISISKGVLTLLARADAKAGLHLPINFFFTALAAACGSQAIGVILSGTASDGTEGLRAIKAEGGITFAQAPQSAKFAGMPSSAIEAGVVDHVLTIPNLVKELVRLSHHPYLSSAEVDTLAPPSADTKVPGSDDATVMAQIKGTVKTVVGVDFAEYKAPTFERRLARRMALRKIDGKEKYLALLQVDEVEVRALYEETLIHVSSFFRDPEVFEALGSTVFPGILKDKAVGEAIRIWVAGCATGEEVYSLALSLLEFLGDSAQPHPVQIFGSDVSELAVQTARAGRYAEAAMRGISEERRRRYFSKIEGGYLINKTVRDLCVFVRHDLASDPPFSKVDLLSCRNVLIYFDQPLQKRLLPLFHYSLNLPGFLLLGRAEDISGFGKLFSCVDKTRKIFARSAARSAVRSLPRGGSVFAKFQVSGSKTAESTRAAGDVGRHLDDLLLRRYAPPGVLVNDRLEILQFRGQTGAYLQPAPGEPQNNVIKMARAGLLSKLRATLARAKQSMAPVRTEGVEVDQDGFTRTCDIVVLPFAGLPHIKEPLFVVLFEEASAGKNKTKGKSRPAARRKPRHAKDAARIPKLEHELSATTDYLHSLIEEHSRTNDDLGSANEELVSGNEELQSLNEELETAKEELQSTNEELTTVNDELHNRNLEASQINSDLVNLLDTVDVPVVILDKQRRIRRFSPQARSLFNIMPSDVGRLLDEIKPKINVPNLDDQIADVIATFEAKESEVQDRNGRWYRMQVRPYKTADHNIDGAIVSLLDINALKSNLDDAQQAIKAAERADRAKDGFLAVLSHELRTPLSALLMQTQFLKQVGADSVKRDRACAAIERSAKKQAQLIDDLLDVSRIVTGKLRVETQPMDLKAVVEASLEGVAAAANAKSITIDTSLGSSPISLFGDRVRLEQVVSNLLNNAIKFTPKGGRVDVLLKESGERAHLTISDNGDGIEAAFLPRVFHRLTQKDSSSTRANSGMGLGLAIVRHLVRAHGGSVTAESPGLGKGSTFHVLLPVIPVARTASTDETIGQATETAPAAEAQVGKLDGKRILVLEDDTSIGEALAEMLIQSGARVQMAESVSEGMTVFDAFHPDVMLCDIAMPGEDGCAFLQRIRALGAARGGDTPALALTALAGDVDRQRAMAVGFQSYLIKPVDLAHLVDATAALLKPGQLLATAGQPATDGSVSHDLSL